MKAIIFNQAIKFTEMAKENYLLPSTIASDHRVGTKIFESPVLAFGDAIDPYFNQLKTPSVIGLHAKHPTEWLENARTVISFFLPFTKEVKNSNGKNRDIPSREWLYGRIEGQDFVNALCLHLQFVIENMGYSSIIPALEPSFFAKTNMDNTLSYSSEFTSNWSERHVGFICGLGSFGLSKGLITKKGMAGRLGSLITTLPIKPDEREYTELYEYCSLCGRCIANCPADAISLSGGKDHLPCSLLINKMEERFYPRYGCGKCQVRVPCRDGIPKKKMQKKV